MRRDDGEMLECTRGPNDGLVLLQGGKLLNRHGNSDNFRIAALCKAASERKCEQRGAKRPVLMLTSKDWSSMRRPGANTTVTVKRSVLPLLEDKRPAG